MRLGLPEAGTPAGVEVQCSELRPLPIDVEAWQRRVLDRSGGSREVRPSEHAETAAGWPVTLIRSDGAEGVAWLHAFYTLVDRCCVVSVRGADAGAVEAMRPALLAADVDWSGDELVALVQLWQP